MVHSYRPSAMALKTLLSTALIRGSPSFLPLPAQNRMVLHHVRITGLALLRFAWGKQWPARLATSI